jgi:HlyD family secretion protein
MNDNQDEVLNIKPAKKFLGIKITKKRVIWTVLVLLVVGFIGFQVFKPKDNSANVQTDTVKKQDLKATVLATGQVVSETDLNLSFKTSGVVKSVSVKEGAKVKAGQQLATLSNQDAYASLTSARGSLAQAQANYNKVLAGASSEDITIAQVALDNAKSTLSSTKLQQDTAVKNSYSALLNTPFQAMQVNGNIGSAIVTITGSYSGTDQGVYKVMVYNSGTGQKFQVSGLESTEGELKSTPVAMGTKGLYIQFSGSVYNGDSWTVAIPNTQSSSYITNYNAYQASLKARDTALSSAENAVASAQAALDFKKAQARPADLQAAQAQILSAQGQVAAAAALVSNTIITAPANGTITSVDIKVGELASALKEVIILQDVGNLHVEANVSEANISSLQNDQEVDITFDALGPDRHFTGKVQTVNPGATVVSGVVNYKVTASIPNISEIKPGMTANMTVLTAQKNSVLAIPSRAVLKNNGSKVRVIDDAKKKTYHEVDVQTGLEADGGLVEIKSGLAEGQEIVTFIKQ